MRYCPRNKLFIVAATVAAAVVFAGVASPGVAAERPADMPVATISGTASHFHQPVENLPVIDPKGFPGLNTVGTGVDKRLTVNTSRPQNETSIAGDPSNAQRIVGGMNDYSVVASGFAGNGVVFSQNGGATWTHLIGVGNGVPLPPGFAARGGDPSIEWDSKGHVFYGSIALGGTGSVFFTDNGIFVGRSNNGGATWNPMVAVATNVAPGNQLRNFEDKCYLTVDQSPASPFQDRIYISWTRFYGGPHPDGGTGGGDIMVARSADGGATWSVLRIALPLNGGTGTIGTSFVQGSEPEVAPNGDVYLTFWFGARIEVWKSTNGGVSFTQMTQPFGTSFGTINVPSPLPNENFRCNAFPNIETHPLKPGYVFVNVADDPDNTFGAGDDADIFFARSIDGGVSWGPKVRLNDDSIQLDRNQIFPWMAVSQRGAIHVIWYDTRNDNANHNLDVYGAASVDGGASFMPNFRVTDCNWNPDTNQFSGNSFFGDYNGIGTTPPNTFHALWTDSRTAGCPQGASLREQEIYYDQITCEVASLMCPPDTVIAAGTNLPTFVLKGFKITNVSTGVLAFDYNVTAMGPGTLNDCGNPASLSGTTPALNPGQSFTPPDACILLPTITQPDTQRVWYFVRPVNNNCWEDTCHTVIEIEAPVPVAFQAFDVRGGVGEIALDWDVIDAVDVVGYNVYRSADAGVIYHRLNRSGLLARGVRSYVDNVVTPGKEYTYKIGAVEPGGEIFSMPRSASARLIRFALQQNKPNPFNPTTTITFVLPSAQYVRVNIYDAQGKLVKRLVNGQGVRGENHVTWDGTNNSGGKVGSGVYYYKLQAGKFRQTRKMVLLK